ncbi:pyridoxamine 5'-phosphate oxidase [Brevibacterium iodinum ATCC 49514]|uniref:Pyridoxamine 5'-phosphate oxidase n=1 Tax=Brevibacterium iodinum ATCC 49514 TaxID=1255616 RepID=A0A2H1KKI8_9MICO|nr:pyridoxal 5'-phosphate synthase [Brevibacterium iodinum]SMY00323.1 pyridoxamine 5'-phosphate oxidase [Brevibacterium iodinum ATCC 49514]SUW70209.1 Phenazine biosynthesis protein phzG [Brevibacterium iodinum]
MNDNHSETLTGHIEVDFPEYLDPPGEPFELLASWLKRAVRLGVREPLAMALATSTNAGQPSIRTVALAELTTESLIFTSHASSRKGQEALANPRVAALFYWRETSEQVCIRGSIQCLEETVADRLWQQRPLATHAMSVASRQSRRLGDVEGLRRTALQLTEDAPLPRPATYRAFEIQPFDIEFWANGNDRLHERLLFSRQGSGWAVSRLQP